MVHSTISLLRRILSNKIKNTDIMKRLMILFLALAAVCNLAEARIVSGSVTCGKKKLSDVIVTDGKNFTKTHKGKFKFEIDDNAEFVYIVTPSGYVADWSSGSPEFYKKAKGVDGELAERAGG